MKKYSLLNRVVVMALLEPDVVKRFNATTFLSSTWVRMDERLTVSIEISKFIIVIFRWMTQDGSK